MSAEHGNVISHLIGDFGKWQATVSLLVSLLKLPIGWFQLSIVFLAPDTPFWCRTPLGNLSRPNDATAFAKNATLNDCDVECSEYAFDSTVFKRTIVSEWFLICEKEQLANVAQMSFMLGVLVGNVVFGIASDRYGRKLPLILAVALQGVTSFMVAFVPWFFWFLVLRFLLAISTGGIMVTSFVLCVEMVGGKWRTSIPILYQIPFGLANSLMALMAYFLRDWRKLTFTMSIISMSFISYWWLVPESPRWLLAVGRHEEAARVLDKAAKSNSLKIGDVGSIVGCLDEKSAKQRGESNSPPFLGLFKTPNLRRHSLVLFFNWFVAGMSVFGFSQYVSFIGKGEDVFVHFAIGGFVTVPGTLICVLVVNRFGRRTTIVTSGLLYGVTCMLVAAVPSGLYAHDWPKIFLAGVSLTCMSVAFSALYLYAGEVFPTVARNGGLGASSMFARIGSMIAPFVLSTRVWSEYVPLMILGVLPILAVSLFVWMPETKGCNLPDSLEDGENFGKAILPQKQKRMEESGYSLMPVDKFFDYLYVTSLFDHFFHTHRHTGMRAHAFFDRNPQTAIHSVRHFYCAYPEDCGLRKLIFRERRSKGHIVLTRYLQQAFFPGTALRLTSLQLSKEERISNTAAIRKFTFL